MYASGLGQGKREEVEERRREQQEQREAEREEARARYPGLPVHEAVRRAREERAAQQQTELFIRENAIYILAIAGGFILLTFARR